MTDLRLEIDEDVILQSSEVERYGSKEVSLDEMVLTNKNIICVYSKSTGLFSKPETVVERIPLSTIRVANGKVQAKIFDSDDYGLGLQIFLKNGQREHFVFYDEKKELQRWEKKVCSIIGEEMPIQTPHVENCDTESSNVFEEAQYELKENIKKAQNDSPEKVVRFCSYCGTKLDVGARFCKNCGEAVLNGSAKASAPKEKEIESEVNPIKENPSERKTVYEGKIYKCPHCGEVMKSFSANCPSCGHEIRGSKASMSVQELAYKLEKIEAQEMQPFEPKKSVMKMVFDRDFNNEDELEEAQDRFDEQKASKKANLIINFSVPNTREDILEFMLLASSNINVKKGLDDEVTKAWLSKLEQVYEKARLLMGNKSDFAQIKYIYDKKKAEIKNRKFKGLAIASYIVGGYVMLFSVLALGDCAYGTFILLLLIGLGLLALGTKFIMIYNKNKRDSI